MEKILTILKSKIHRATVTDANTEYQGSISIDERLMEQSDILPYEQVHVCDVNNGKRFVTYAIPGEKGQICVNGAAAKLVNVGDIVIILTYQQINASSEELASYHPKVVMVDSQNVAKEIRV
jgi:aspartate 1-decarboxylase